MTFASEDKFEDALIQILKQKGWEEAVINRPTEQDLIDNWARILFENNRGIDRLNNVPLTDSEMQQLIEQINTLKTPLKLNGFINGKTVSITRDNPDDTFVVRLIVLKNSIKFNALFLESAINQKKIFVESTGVPQLTVPQFGKLCIYSPDIEEQIAIGEFFKQLDDTLSLQAKQLKTLDNLKQALLAKMFV